RRFNGSAHQVLSRGTASEAADKATRVGIPVRRSQSDKGGDQKDPLRILLRSGDGTCFGRRGDDAEAVSQPLKRRAGDEDRAFERVCDVATNPPGYRAQHARLAARYLGAGVEQNKRSGAIGALRHPGAEASLSEESRLLVPGHAADDQLQSQEMVAIGAIQRSGTLDDVGQKRSRDP